MLFFGFIIRTNRILSPVTGVVSIRVSEATIYKVTQANSHALIKKNYIFPWGLG